MEERRRWGSKDCDGNTTLWQLLNRVLQDQAMG